MAAAPSSLGTQIREELSCSICLELFTRPKVLPCQHTFCQHCLQDHVGSEVIFQCPNCRVHARRPPNGVADFPDNYLVTNLCDTLQRQATVSGGTSEQPQSGNTCSIHPSEQFKVYCKQCRMPVCELCLEEAHNDHRTTTIKKAAEEMKTTVRNLITEGKNILETYFISIRSLRDKEKTLNDRKQQTDSCIIQSYNEMVQKLTERKDHLLLVSEQHQRENLRKIQIGREGLLADVNELSAACDRAEQEMERENGDFLNLEIILTELVGEYKEIAAFISPVQTQPAVFESTDTPVPVLGRVVVQSILPEPIPGAPTYSNVSARATDRPHTSREEEECIQFHWTTFGGKGTETGQFNDPSGAAVSEEGEIFITDKGNQRIQVFTLQGEVVRQFPTVTSNEERMDPHDVAMDREGNLWVVGDLGVTGQADFAVQYTQQGQLLRKFELQKTKWGRGVAIDTRTNYIFITRTTGESLTHSLRGEVQVFEPDGTLVRTLGEQQRMKVPWNITISREGNIMVSDYDDHCVYVFNEDGQCAFKFGGEECRLKHPCGICTDGSGNIIVVNRGLSCVDVVGKPRMVCKHITTEVEWPWAVAKASQGPLVVTDSVNNTVNIFYDY